MSVTQVGKTLFIGYEQEYVITRQLQDIEAGTDPGKVYKEAAEDNNPSSWIGHD